MESFTIARSGRSPVAFDGELLAASSADVVRGQQRNRWHEIKLFRTVLGTYVVAIAYRTCWQGEEDRSMVESVSTAEEASKILEGYDPTEGFCPYPDYPGAAGKTNAAHNEKIARGLRFCYQAQVSKILSTDAAFQQRIA